MSSFFSPSAADSAAMHGAFMGFAQDAASLDALRGWAGRQGFPAATVQEGGPDLFAQLLENAPPPKRAVIDIDGVKEPVECAARIVSLCGGDCRVIVIGAANDVALYRGMMGAGAVDYLVKPLAAETLNQAMAVALKGGVGGKLAAKDARAIVFIGARGGVGATTIAVNAGWLMAHEFTRQVALLDLDLQFGTSALSLDLEPGRGLRDIVSSPHRVDGLMIASSLVAESDAFSLLAAEEAVDEAAQIDGAAIDALLREMRANFDFILVDLPRHSVHEQKRLLATASEIVLVTELSLAGIRDTLRLKQALRGLDSPARITVVASRTGAGQLDVAAFEKGAQIKLDCVIPEDVKTIAAAANSGKPVAAVARQAAVTKALCHLAERLCGPLPEGARKPSGFWRKLAGPAKKPQKDKGA